MDSHGQSKCKTFVRVLELYCGIGGFHWALKLASGDRFKFEVVASIDINPTVLQIYKHNFPSSNIINRNLESLTADEINKMKVDMIVLSPPCQPFCRTGLQMDLQDNRTNSFQHLLDILPDIQFKYMVLENVQGFETSDARNLLIEALEKCNLAWQEYLTSPTDVGVPNSRLRYYMIAKHRSLGQPFSSSGIQSLKEIVPSLHECDKIQQCDLPFSYTVKSEMEVWRSRRAQVVKSGKVDHMPQEHPPCVADIIEQPETDSSVVPAAVQEKYQKAMDIVTPSSTSTCCFTKSYGQYVKGTGSILSYNKSDGTSDLRFFTPREVLRLMCYPDSFQMPSEVSVKQQYKALGNSLNPYVVSILISLLIW